MSKTKRSVVFTEMFHDIIRRLPNDDITNLCKLDNHFQTLCRENNSFIQRELQRRQFYVKIDTDLDDPEDVLHTVTVTKKEPAETFGDFFQTHRFERLDYNYTDVYVLFHYTSSDTFADTIELFVDRAVAESEFYKVVGDYVKQVTRMDDSLDSTIYDSYNDTIHRWRLVRVPVQ